MSDRASDWFLASTLAGVTFAASTANVVLDPSLISGIVTAGMGIVFVLLSQEVVPRKVMGNE